MTRKSNIHVLQKYENGRIYAVPLVEEEKLPTCQVCFEEFQSHRELSHHYRSSHPQYRAGEQPVNGSSSEASSSKSPATTPQSSGSSRPECQGENATGAGRVSEPTVSGPSGLFSASNPRCESPGMEAQSGGSAGNVSSSPLTALSSPSTSIHQEAGPSQIGYQGDEQVENCPPSTLTMINQRPTVVQPSALPTAMQTAPMDPNIFNQLVSPTNNNFPVSAVTGQPMSLIGYHLNGHQPIPAEAVVPMNTSGVPHDAYATDMAPEAVLTNTTSSMHGAEDRLIANPNENAPPNLSNYALERNIVSETSWSPRSPPRPAAPPPTPMGSLPERIMSIDSMPPGTHSTGQQNFGQRQVPVSARGLVNPLAADPADVQWTTTRKTLRSNLSVVNRNTIFYHIAKSEKRLFRASEIGVNIRDQRRWHDMDIYLTRDHEPLVAHARLYERGNTRIIFLDDPSVYILSVWLTKQDEIRIPETGKCCIQEYPESLPGNPTLWFSRQSLTT